MARGKTRAIIFLKSIFKNCPAAHQCVFEADFFAFAELSRRVAYWNFQYFMISQQKFCGNLGFELEAIALYIQIF